MDAGRPRSPFAMEVVVEPPRTVRPGQILHPPLVVGIRVEKTLDIGIQFPSSQILDDANGSSGPPRHEQEGLHGQYEALWAFVSLIPRFPDPAGSRPPLPRCHTLGLSGTLTDSPHRLPDTLRENNMIYVKFQDLTINSAGIFGLHVALCRMPWDGEHSGLAPGVAMTIGCISSRDIVVHPCSPNYLLGI